MIRTERLWLRPVVPSDAPAMHAYRGQADVCRYLPWDPMSLTEVRRRIAEVYVDTRITGPGDNLTLGVTTSADGPLIGDVVLFWRDGPDRLGEVGYVFAPEVTGQGYATEAARAVIDFGFHEVGLHRIIGRIDARNSASGAVLSRLGLRQEAHFVRNEFFKGEWTDEIIYAVLADEWPAGG